MERTFAIIKPDAVAANQAGDIIAIAQKAGFRVAGMKMKCLSQLEAEGFYAVHRVRGAACRAIRAVSKGRGRGRRWRGSERPEIWKAEIHWTRGA